MKIEVINLDNVLVNGVNAGKLMDVFSNYKSAVAEIQAAIAAWAGKVKADHDAELQTQLQAQAAEQAEKEASLQSQIELLTVERDALGTSEQAAEILKQQRIATLKQQQANTAAELATLESVDEVQTQ
jgi:uncharacterized protein involved in exopolysaccharide biosynthesis